MENQISLFTMNQDLMNVSQYLAECETTGNNPDPEMLTVYENICKAITTKVDNCYDFDSFLKSQVERFKLEKLKIENKIDIIKAMQTRFNKYLLQIAKGNNGELVGEIHKLKVSSRASVMITNADELSMEYKRTKTTIEPDKKKIGDDLKALKEVKGAELVYNDSAAWKLR